MENTNVVKTNNGAEAVNAELITPEKAETVALYLLQKAEIDSQIATAHAFPRSLETFKKRATEMATLDVETAGSCIYRRPVGKDEYGKQTFAEGKSIRMAEIVGACYGNLRVGATIIEQTPRQVIARGFAHDLETNFAATSECIEATVKKNGQPYDERMRVVVAKVALAKARRDATFMVVPGALCKTIEVAARETALGKGQTMEQRRKNAMEWISKLAIDVKRVWAALSVNGIEDCGIEELTTLKGLKTAITDKDITIEEAFPVPGAEDKKTDEQKESERMELLIKDAKTQEDLNKLRPNVSEQQTELFAQRMEELA